MADIFFGFKERKLIIHKTIFLMKQFLFFENMQHKNVTKIVFRINIQSKGLAFIIIYEYLS